MTARWLPLIIRGTCQSLGSAISDWKRNDIMGYIIRCPGSGVLSGYMRLSMLQVVTKAQFSVLVTNLEMHC